MNLSLDGISLLSHDSILLGILSVWIAITVLCWISQATTFTKKTFSYGKLNHNESGESFWPSWMYTTHSLGFGLYYYISLSITTFFILLFLITFASRVFNVTLGDYQSIVLFSLGKHQNNALVQILKQVHQAPTQDKWDVLADKLVIHNTGALIVLVLILFHFIRRVYETLYVHKSSKGKTASKQHIFVTISGLLYYVFVIVSPVFGSTIFAIDTSWTTSVSMYPPTVDPISRIMLLISGVSPNHIFLQENDTSSFVPLWNWWLLLRLSVGVSVFVFGSYTQYRAHQTLANLRTKVYPQEQRSNDNKKTTLLSIPEQPYKIPSGGFMNLFNLVATPHYFAEIIIYLGILIIFPYNVQLDVTSTAFDIAFYVESFFSSPSVLGSVVRTGLSAILNGIAFIPSTSFWCLIWVISNLSITAIGTLTWYKDTFREKYPKDRKALVPYLF